jgi:hypothetical protein
MRTVHKILAREILAEDRQEADDGSEGSVVLEA